MDVTDEFGKTAQSSRNDGAEAAGQGDDMLLQFRGVPVRGGKTWRELVRNGAGRLSASDSTLDECVVAILCSGQRGHFAMRLARCIAGKAGGMLYQVFMQTMQNRI